MAEKYSRKQVKILIKGGTEKEWANSGDSLLEGELGYEINAKNTRGLTILKIGEGDKSWPFLDVDENGHLTDKVFFSGRGAGIQPPVMSNDTGIPLGGIRLHDKTSNNKKHGLVVDKNGFLSLWNIDGYFSLELDELKVGKLIADYKQIENITADPYLKLRLKIEEGVEVPLPSLQKGEYSGIIVKNYDGENDNFLVSNNLGKWGIYNTKDGVDSLTLLASMESKIKEGPVQLTFLENSNGEKSQKQVLSSWEPNSLTLSINKKTQSIFKPYGNDSINYVNIPTLTEIKVLTREFAEGEKPSPEEIYKIDEEGKITIELPLITGYSIDKWDKKVDDIQLNGTSLIPENSESKIGNILVDASTLENNIITAPIQKISYDGKELPIEAHKVSILPEKYDITESETFKDDSETFINIGKTYDSSNLTHTYSVGIKHALHAIDVANTPIYQFGKDFTAIEVHRYSFNKYGHAEGNTIIHYSFTDLLERIDKLEKNTLKIQELENQIKLLENRVKFLEDNK